MKLKKMPTFWPDNDCNGNTAGLGPLLTTIADNDGDKTVLGGGGDIRSPVCVKKVLFIII